MATEGYVKFEYFSKGVPPYYGNSSFPELLDDESIVVKTPNIEMSYHQYFGLFKKFLMSVGFNEKNIMQGACSIAFNEMNDEKTMREVAEEYDLVMNEDLPALMEDRLKEEKVWVDKMWLEQNKSEPDIWEKRYYEVRRKLIDLENEKRANDSMPPWGHSDMEALKYTDEELDAMCDKAASEVKYHDRRVAADCMTWDQAIAEGWEMTADGFWIKEPKEKDLKMWNGLIPGSSEAVEKGCMCPVMDNEEMPHDKKWVDAECPIHGRKKND
jgi:hypothetical protein